VRARSAPGAGNDPAGGYGPRSQDRPPRLIAPVVALLIYAVAMFATAIGSRQVTIGRREQRWAASGVLNIIERDAATDENSD
jgi:hypothetical protein